MLVQTVLFEYEDCEQETLFSSSATLLNNRWIILPAASFVITLKKEIPVNLESLENSKIHFTNFYKLTTEKIKIISNTSTKEFKFQHAKYIGMFSCNNIKKTNDFPLGCIETNDSGLDCNDLLSLFMIFDLKMSDKFEEKHFFDTINELVKISNIVLFRGHIISVESTPFGSRDLLGSLTEGIFSNSVGENNIFLLTDAPTAPGSEGAPIFAFKNNIRNSTKIPVGLVISSLNLWRGEPTGLTLGAFFVPLLSQLLPKKWSIKEYLFSNKNSIINSAEKSVVQIFCGSGWGTGILIDKKNGFFLTGSHVVQSAINNKIMLKWRNNSFPGTLIYRTESSPFDIAIVSCSVDKIDKMSAIKFATKPAVKGEAVLAVGFPIFKQKDHAFPVITKGNISLAEFCILHTTCCILPGSSGGAILRENGDLLGIIVCHITVNFKDEMKVYPRVNMAVPISAVGQILYDYIKTKETKVLEKLETHDPYVKNKWQFFQNKL